MELVTLRVQFLEVEDEVAKDEVDVTKVMLKITRIKPSCIIDVATVKKGAEEVGPSQKWNASCVASTTTMQENADRQAVTTIARLVI